MNTNDVAVKNEYLKVKQSKKLVKKRSEEVGKETCTAVVVSVVYCVLALVLCLAYEERYDQHKKPALVLFVLTKYLTWGRHHTF